MSLKKILKKKIKKHFAKQVGGDENLLLNTYELNKNYNNSLDNTLKPNQSQPIYENSLDNILNSNLNLGRTKFRSILNLVLERYR